MDRCDCLVIGAGVVGLAVARALALAGREVIVVEEADKIGTVTSSRNSEVIHAGLYYPPGSLKARFCRRGRDLLYDYVAERGIAHVRCGKLVVACDENEIASLKAVAERAKANRVDDLRWISGDDARAMEPELRCLGALVSPSTGIFDSHGYMLNLQGDAEAAGTVFAFHARVCGGRVRAEAIEIDIETGGEVTSLACTTVVNSAGHGAQTVARGLIGMPPGKIPPQHYSKGTYFSLTAKPPFSMLVYPPPDHASIGLHYTRDLAGRGRFGPDAEWVDDIDYTVDPARAALFYESIRHYWPALPEGSLVPDYVGMRPKIQAPGEPPHDFVIQGPDVHGIPGLIHLFGIESPGLTSSMAIAEEVAKSVASF